MLEDVIFFVGKGCLLDLNKFNTFDFSPFPHAPPSKPPPTPRVHLHYLPPPAPQPRSHLQPSTHSFFSFSLSFWASHIHLFTFILILSLMDCTPSWNCTPLGLESYSRIRLKSSLIQCKLPTRAFVCVCVRGASRLLSALNNLQRLLGNS